MLFNSFIFLIFGALFFLIWSFVRKKQKPRWITLVVSSFIFYGWWDWRFLFLIIASGLIDFFAGIKMKSNPQKKNLYLILSLLGNIGSLAIFKYSSFIASNLDFLMSLIGIETGLQYNIPDFVLILPVGISFYTFQSMSYSIDVYKGKLEPVRNIFHFFSYLALFPQLVAGPIVRARDLLGRLASYTAPSEDKRWEGLRMIAYGFFMKVVIADNLAPIVNHGFESPVMLESSLYWWYITTLFAFQIYYDFAGYSQIARGLMTWLGYDIARNFNHPYTAVSLKDFWNRWHISLSSWFRDYLYIPLGGSKGGIVWGHIAMWITMLVSGLWHGAAWNFVIWGAIHAFFLSLERVSKYPDFLNKSIPGNILSRALIILQVWIAWVFFRSVSFDQATDILRMMFSVKTAQWNFTFDHGFFLVLAIAPEIIYPVLKKSQLRNQVFKYRIAEAIWMALVIAACIFLRGPGSEFIYFQF